MQTVSKRMARLLESLGADVGSGEAVLIDIPLLIRLLEYAREDSKKDVDLHVVATNAVALGKKDGKLSMKHYASLIPSGKQKS